MEAPSSFGIAGHGLPFRRVFSRAPGLVALASLLAPGPARAVGTAFTYQGRLVENGKPRERARTTSSSSCSTRPRAAARSSRSLTPRRRGRRRTALHGGPGLRPVTFTGARAGWSSACGPAPRPAPSHAPAPAAGADARAQRDLRRDRALVGRPGQAGRLRGRRGQRQRRRHHGGPTPPGNGLVGGAAAGAVTLGVGLRRQRLGGRRSRVDHDHVGQTWSGSSTTGLSITNAAGAALRGLSTSTAVSATGVDGVTRSRPGVRRPRQLDVDDGGHVPHGRPRHDGSGRGRLRPIEQRRRRARATPRRRRASRRGSAARASRPTARASGARPLPPRGSRSACAARPPRPEGSRSGATRRRRPPRARPSGWRDGRTLRSASASTASRRPQRVLPSACAACPFRRRASAATSSNSTGGPALGVSAGGIRFADGTTQTTAGTGDITGVAAGAGLSGGGTSGSVSAQRGHGGHAVPRQRDLPGGLFHPCRRAGGYGLVRNGRRRSGALTGNAGTNPSTNFIGTTDNVPFEIRTNNERALRFERRTVILGPGSQAISSNVIAGHPSNVTVAANVSDGHHRGRRRVADGSGGLPAQRSARHWRHGRWRRQQLRRSGRRVLGNHRGRARQPGRELLTRRSAAEARTRRTRFYLHGSRRVEEPGRGQLQPGGRQYRARVRRATEVGGGDGDGDEGTFAWADSAETDFLSTGPNRFP